MPTSDGLHRVPVWKHLLLLCCVVLESQTHQRKTQIRHCKFYLSRCWLISSCKMLILIITTLSKLPQPFIPSILMAWWPRVRNCCYVLGLWGWIKPCISRFQGIAILWTECCVWGGTVKKLATETDDMTISLGRRLLLWVGKREDPELSGEVQSREKE